MRRTTVYLKDDQAVRLKRAAGRCGRSEADLIRQGIEMMLQATPVERPEPSLFFDSGDPTWAERVDEMLGEGFGEDGSET